MILCKHAIFQNILRRAYNCVLQCHIIGIIRVIELANIPMICVKVLNSFSSKTESFNRKTIRLSIESLELEFA